MIRILTLSLFLFALSTQAFAQDEPKKPTVNDLAWLAGCWTQESGPGRVSYEQWSSPGGLMIGMARTVRDGRIVDYEFLKLIEKEGDVYYVAIPARQKETHFKLTSLKEGVAVFENPDHDFPNTITYTRGSDKINVRVQGNSNGQVRGFELNFSPGDC
ncbi:MAG: hypothetical protein DWQ47_11180 [Acidobacteria bacterium]|nr:MAG: hypothetical protein DWQ32_13595 [Acidobacteriota bacterium]REJ98142.1 MAG: hypothetical protein DWQ38_16395 [Acidobacteriota bacterium]REK16885.1 MAG: hypothetical protein DWQ43_01440 [Acidobacteriota bacterium]REK42796.1 MAG: hypothetical protein DWQ47_11180 [Acidobacteriota bacterium]